MPLFQSSGKEIFYDVYGDGLPLVLMHAFMTSSDIWTSQVKLLSRKYCVITLDWPGHGRSAPVTTPFSLDDLATHVVDLLDHLRIELAVWAGASMGGMVALRGALTHADRVSGLVLMGTHAGPESVLNIIKYRALEWGVRPFGLRPFLPAIMPLMFGSTARRSNRQLVRTWRTYVAQLDVTSMVHTLDALMAREPLADRLAEISVPTLVIVGTEDETLPPLYAEEIAKGICGAKLMEIPGAGHLAALERPDWVNPHIVKFLDEVA